MAHLQRLILAVVVLLLSSVASATINPIYKWYPQSKGAGTLYDTPDAACAAGTPPANSLGPSPGSSISTVQWQCKWIIPYNGSTAIVGSDTASRTSVQYCPAHSTNVSGACTCDTGFEEKDGACSPKPKACPAPGTLYSEGTSRSISGGPAPPVPDAVLTVMRQAGTPPRCSEGCGLMANMDNPVVAYAGGQVVAGYKNGVWTINIPRMEYDGTNCTSSDRDIRLLDNWQQAQSTGSPAPVPCAAGKVPGTVNGTNVCVNPGQVATSSGSSSTSSGQTTTGGSGGTGNPNGTGGDGSGSGSTIIGSSGPKNSSDTSITVCDGSTCTTTSTSTSTSTAGTGTSAGGGSGSGSGGSGGSGTGSGTAGCAQAAAAAASAAAGGATCTNTTTTTQSQTDFCKSNPKAAQCTASQSSFGGACASGFTAKSDDAVINAMAEETFRQNCKVNPADSETTLANTERVKTGDRTTDNPNNTSTSISASSIDTSDALNAGASCISDKTITVFGSTQVVLPFSKACDSFPILGTLLVAVSFLVAGVIILRG